MVGPAPITGIPSGTAQTGGDSNASCNIIFVMDREDVVARIAETIEALDVRPLQVLVEATILEALLTDSCALGVDFNALGGIDFSDVNSSWNVNSVTVGDATGNQLDKTLIGAEDTGFTSDNPAEGFSFSILHDEVALFIEAIENVTDTNVIANPKILALNYQSAEIIIGGRLGYYGASTISDGLSQQSVEFLDTGTQLRFRPFISTDGYVRLEIHPQRSDGVVDPTTGLPSENTSEVTTNIMVKDGDTVVIGGLIEEIDQKVESRVPFLGTLPFIGWLFRRSETETRRSEIIVMITPRIIDPADNDENAEEDIREFEQRKQLFRDGFLFCSRTIYAERHMEKARLSYQEGDLGWARYHINRAAYLDPNNQALVPLKNRIDDASSQGGARERGMEDFLRSDFE
jgi:type IV pilus assembly protein PilQ